MPRTELRARARLALRTAACLSVLVLAATCALVPALAETSTCETHTLEAFEAVDATCTEDGTEAYWICSVCGALFSDADATTQIDEPVAIAATGHDYSSVTFTWSGSSATYTAVCTNDSSHTLSGNAKVSTVSSVAASCTSSGSTTYTASATVKKTTYIDTKTVTIPAFGHDYDYDYASGTWDWTGSDEEGWTAATYTYGGTCANDSSHTVIVGENAEVTVAETLTADGLVGMSVYTASVTVNGLTYTDVKTVCTHDPSFIVVVDAAEATCTEPATASCWQCETCGAYFADADATEEIDAPEETGDATGHSWRYATGEFSWSDDHASATYVVPCSNGCGETEEYEATVSTSTTSATCASAGSIVYTTSVAIDGVTYSSTYTKLIAVTDHDIDLSSATWTWASDHSSATVSAVCKVCCSTVELSADSVTSEVTTAATATSTGVRTWTASITYGGETCTAIDVETFAQLSNTLAVKGRIASVKVASLKKRAVKLAVSKVMRVTAAKGIVRYKKKSGDKALTVNKKTGAVTVKKGARKGVHKLKIAVTAAGTSSYAAATKVVTIKVRVR